MASRAKSELESKPKRSPWLVRIVAAPLVLIERARGRKRFAVLVLYGLIVVGAVAVFQWATSLNGLPDVGDPAAVVALRALEVPDERNAFVLYRRAAEAFQELPQGEDEAVNTFNWDGGPIDWQAVDPALKDGLAANREALDLWRAGSERPDALLIRTEELASATLLGTANALALLEPADALHDFCWLGLLEAARLEAEGDMAGAWGWYRAALRASRHAGRHGSLFQRRIGTSILVQEAAWIDAWAADGRTDADLLRRALADVQEARALTSPASEALGWEYLVLMNMTDRAFLPGWLSEERIRPDSDRWWMRPSGARAALSLGIREPERSRRVVRLIFANWLTACDLPVEARPPLLATGAGLNLYQVGPGAPEAARALSPAEVQRWFETTIVARKLVPDNQYALPSLDRDRVAFETLTIRLAEELYRREHGDYPTRYPELVEAGYLDELPAGYADLPTPASAE